MVSSFLKSSLRVKGLDDAIPRGLASVDHGTTPVPGEQAGRQRMANAA